MKKYLFIFTLLLIYIAPSFVFAQTPAAGSPCTPTGGTTNSGTYSVKNGCVSNTTVPSSVSPTGTACGAGGTSASGKGCTGAVGTSADGTLQAGQACSTNDACSGDLACINNTCQVDPSLNTPAAAPTSAASSNTSTNFIPLTALPGISAIAGTTGNGGTIGLADFLNTLYKICIGVAAALAFLQIVRAGITWMMAGDSTEKVSEAKKLIADSLLGLVLVLSPVIVFSIINPNVLSFKVLDSDLNSIAPSNGSSASTMDTTTSVPTVQNGTVQSGAATCTAKIANGAVVTSANDQACCNSQPGCKVSISIPKGGDVLSSNSATCSCSS